MATVLAPGDSLGPYTIDGQVGAGAMGTVYRARDVRLQRTVAIKVMTSAGPDLAQADRFRQEAVAVASLNNPNICAIYDVGEQGGLNFLVMEFVDGETLAERLARAPIPLAEAISLGCQLATTLESAHRAGIVHRDLKPSNVMLTNAGPKLLDFGLATIRGALPLSGQADVTKQALTTVGTIVGTVPYMAPEVLEGKAADARSDLFALGAILFEMLTRHRAFPGDASTTVIAAILRSTPPAISQSVPGATASLDRTIRRCLEKNPEQRWQNGRDLALDLADWNASGPPSVHVAASRPWWPIAAAVIVALGLGAIGWSAIAGVRRPVTVAVRTMRFQVPVQDGTTFTPSEAGRAGAQLAVSPDGQRIVFVAATADHRQQLWVRSLDSITAAAVPNTEGATFPFWAPDGQSIAFFAGGKLVRVSPGGGELMVLCDAPVGLGGAWGPSGVILVSTSFGKPISRVSASGGEMTAVTKLNDERQETDHAWPQFLPDRRHFVFGAHSRRNEDTGVYLGDLESPTVKRLTNAASRGIVIGEHLLFWREGRLLSQRLDMKALALTGEPELVAADVARGLFIRYASVAAGGDTLVYQPSMKMTSQLTWVDRAGGNAEPLGEPGEYFNLALSPDERHVAVSTIAPPSLDRDIWSIDLVRKTLSRLTSDPSEDMMPIWSPDGLHVAYVSDRTGTPNVYRRAASGVGDEEVVLASPSPKFTSDWSADNKYILFDAINPGTRFDVWAFALGSKTAAAVVTTRFVDRQGKLSRDGRWIAFASEETGKPEVYVRHFPVTDERWQISTRGGSQPMWRDDGRELFYLDPAGAVMSVALNDAGGFSAGLPRRLFDSGILNLGGGADSNQYAVANHGQRFLVNRSTHAPAQPPLVVVTNWSESRH